MPEPLDGADLHAERAAGVDPEVLGTDADDHLGPGEQALRDAALLHLVRVRAATLAALTGGSPGDVRLGPVIPSGPSGGYAAMALTVAVTITAVTA